MYYLNVGRLLLSKSLCLLVGRDLGGLLLQIEHNVDLGYLTRSVAQRMAEVDEGQVGPGRDSILTPDSYHIHPEPRCARPLGNSMRE